MLRKRFPQTYHSPTSRARAYPEPSNSTTGSVRPPLQASSRPLSLSVCLPFHLPPPPFPPPVCLVSPWAAVSPRLWMCTCRGPRSSAARRSAWCCSSPPALSGRCSRRPMGSLRRGSGSRTRRFRLRRPRQRGPPAHTGATAGSRRIKRGGRGTGDRGRGALPKVSRRSTIKTLAVDWPASLRSTARTRDRRTLGPAWSAAGSLPIRHGWVRKHS